MFSAGHGKSASRKEDESRYKSGGGGRLPPEKERDVREHWEPRATGGKRNIRQDSQQN